MKKKTQVKPPFFILRAMLLLGIILMLAFSTKPGVAVIKGDIELLNLIADGYEANFEKLKTWQGEANMDWSLDSKIQTDVRYQSEKQKATFLVVRNFNAAKWTNESFERILNQNGTKHELDPERSSGMMKKNRVYTMDLPDKQSEEDHSLYLQINAKDQVVLNFESKHFDPLHILETISSSPIPERLRGYYNNWNNPKLSPGNITRDGDIVTFEVTQQISKGTVVERHVFDLSKGCSLLEYYNSSPHLSETHWQLTYEKVSGVFVPNSISMRYEDKRPGQKRITKKNAVITTKMVNESVKAEEFELDKLGWRPGDEIIDAVSNSNTLYEWIAVFIFVLAGIGVCLAVRKYSTAWKEDQR